MSGNSPEFYDNLEHKSIITLLMLLDTFLSGLNTKKLLETNNQSSFRACYSGIAVVGLSYLG